MIIINNNKTIRNSSNIKIISYCFQSYFHVFAVFYNKSEILKQELSFKINGDVFQTLPEVCGEKNINLAILTKRKFFMTGSFNKSSLGNIFKIILEDDMELEYTNSFLIVRDRKPLLKTYNLSVSLEEDEKKEIEKFIKDFSEKNTNSYYVYNKEEGTILYYGHVKEHNIIKKYIQHINHYYGQQVYLECKIITIRTLDQKRKLDIIDIISGLLSIIDIPSATKDKISIRNGTIKASKLPIEKDNLDKMRFIIGYLKENYQVLNIQELHLVLRNKSTNKFQNMETRYLDRFYDSKMLPISDVENKIKATVVKNVKELQAGIKLVIKTQIESKVYLKIEYEQSSFKDRGHNIPEVAANSFSAAIQLDYDQIVALNGLTVHIKENNKQNNSGFFLLNWLFGRNKKEESKCQIIFLIRVKRQNISQNTLNLKI